MNLADCCEMIRIQYALIGSGEQGYMPKSIGCAIRALNRVASDENIALELREQAAYAAANLLISDHKDI
ncbi:YaeP family protein [Vibrio sp. SS-MA-C1-2]|uniref:YaeP family protein n=1 Tax=Vibrio sp. SS-MA-C1-2 TaxID=2908646 RepID=UPI001F2D2B34|nr:YaeP family protein [Vibrio sp. SS-MA-C1-2]UJF18884.1 YaeP family protein [Vibrio sp. SS-MA-C1-2]